VSPARTFAASKEVKTLAISSESLLTHSAAASPSLELLPLIGAPSPDLVSRASLPLTVISHWRCRLICYSGKSSGLSNPCSSGVLYNGGCISLGNSGNGNRSSGKR
nr:hypothetical protein [Tanacetum cinerariifolium]